MDLLELLRKGGMDGDVDFLREALRVLVEGIMDAEVSARTGAEYGERSPERVTQRNGYRSRTWDTRVGTMELHIPKLREGSYFPSLLEPRRRSERALLAVIQQAYVEGVSTRRVDDLIKALGCEGISTQRPDGRGSPRRSPAPRGAADITARSSAAARAAVTTDGITGAADSEGSPAQGSPPQGHRRGVRKYLSNIYNILALRLKHKQFVAGSHP